MSSGELWTVLLAGGDGVRLRELTRLASGAVVPKQYCALEGPSSLARLALARALRITPAARTLAVVTARHRRWWRRDLPELPRANRLVQPVHLGTAPALLLAAREAWRRDRDATLLTVPTGHFVDQEWRLAVALLEACDLARKRPKRLVVVGTPPDAGFCGCGWIVPDPGRRRKRAVAAFVPAADECASRELVESGSMLYTCFLAVRAATLIEIFDEHLPEVAECFRMHAGARTGRLAGLYRDLPQADLAQDLLAHAIDRLELFAAPRCGWSDLKTPARVAAYLEGGSPAPKVFGGGSSAAPLQLAEVIAPRRSPPLGV